MAAMVVDAARRDDLVVQRLPLALQRRDARIRLGEQEGRLQQFYAEIDRQPQPTFSVTDSLQCWHQPQDVE